MLTGSDGRTIPYTATKLVLLNNDFVFGYTGFAEIPDKGGNIHLPDKWLLEVLAKGKSRDLPTIIDTVTNSANEAYKRVTYRNHPTRRLCFFGVGWHRQSAYTSPLPTYVWISNYIREDGTTCDAPFGDFRGYFKCEGNYGYFSWSVGHPRTYTEWRWLGTALKNAWRPEYDAEATMGVLTTSIRQTSKRLHNRWVGKDVLGAILPREAFGAEPVVVRGLQSGRAIICYREQGMDIPPWGAEHCSHFLRYEPKRRVSEFHSPQIVCTDLNQAALWMPDDGRSGALAASICRKYGGVTVQKVCVEVTPLRKGRKRKRKRRKA